MSKTDKVRVTNQPTGIFSTLCILSVIFSLMSVAGCDACKGTDTGLQCMGKAYREIEDDFKKGYAPENVKAEQAIKEIMKEISK